MAHGGPVSPEEEHMAGDAGGQTTEIKLVGVYKTYQMGEVEVPVLRGIDCEIYKGQLTVILGSSGAGKSTLLNMIGGVDRPTKGEVRFGGKDIATFNDRRGEQGQIFPLDS